MKEPVSDKMLLVNLACGGSYIDAPEWINLDYSTANTAVRKANILGTLPFENGTVDVVYCSHFIEHIPRERVNYFLTECYRILKPGKGVARFVLPDFGEICREYLYQRESGNHAKADFAVMEIIDQCVRLKSGGELGALYKSLKEKRDNNIAEYIFERCGENISNDYHDKETGGRWLKLFKHPSFILSYLEKKYCRFISLLLPSAFREQNISFAEIGEKHMWLYDEHMLTSMLAKCGFTNIVRMPFDKTLIPNFPLYPLDISEDGRPRKGKESMYLEAFKA
ncbi:MAG: methyltransferase protein [Firmicutes bacterium]|nr:methyltransferase protein [Bacillota bacterium]